MLPKLCNANALPCALLWNLRWLVNGRVIFRCTFSFISLYSIFPIGYFSSLSFFSCMFASQYSGSGWHENNNNIYSQKEKKITVQRVKKYILLQCFGTLGRTDTIHFRYFVHFAVCKAFFFLVVYAMHKMFHNISQRHTKCKTKEKTMKKWKERTAKVESVKIYIAIFSLYLFFSVRSSFFFSFEFKINIYFLRCVFLLLSLVVPFICSLFFSQS